MKVKEKGKSAWKEMKVKMKGNQKDSLEREKMKVKVQIHNVVCTSHSVLLMGDDSILEILKIISH